MTYFITGATGFIGSHFLAEHAAAQPVIALVRGETADRARARLAAALHTAGDARPTAIEIPSDNVECVLGDVERDHLGISIEDRQRLAQRNIDIFWHFAADLNFEKRKADKIYNVNVEGVRRAVTLAAELGAQRFVYVSTAYTAGPMTGEVPETLHDLNGQFNNSYERSKCQAEHLVADTCAKHGLEFTILRPSVIIGMSSTKRSGGSTTGMYAFIRDLYLLRRALDTIDAELTFSADPDMTVNFNPIDGVLADIQYLIDRDFAGGPVHHLTATTGVKLGHAFEVAKAELGISQMRIADQRAATQTPLDEMIGKRAEFYKSYVFNEKDFARSIPLQHGCSAEDLPGYVRSYIAELDAQFADTVCTAEQFTSSDGITVTAYRTPPVATPRPAVLICTAFGIPVDIWRAFIRRAGAKYDVYVWDTRYLPSDAPLDTTDISVQRHCQDGVEVLAHFGIERAHLIGWCTGAKIALRIAAAHPELVDTVTLLSGGFNIVDSALKTPYEVNLTDVLTEIAADRDLAELYYDLIYNGGDEDADSDATVRTFLNDTNPDYVQYTSLPFTSADNIYRYAQLITTFSRDTDSDYMSTVTAPALTIAARTDNNTHPDASRYVAAAVVDGRCYELPEGDHYLMDSRNEVVFARFDAHAGAVSRNRVELT